MAVAALEGKIAVLATDFCMNIHQTEAHARFLESIGWKVVKHRFNGQDTYYYLIKIPFLPIYFLKIQRLPEELIDWKFVEKLKQEYRIYEMVVEVDKTGERPPEISKFIERYGFRPETDFMLTTKTRLIDLTKPSATLIKEMKPKTRYNLHKAKQNNLATKTVGLEVAARHEEYFKLLQSNAKRIGMLMLPKEWLRQQWLAFKKNGFLIEVRSKEGELVAVSTFYTSQTDCSYNMNGSTEMGRHLFGPTLAIWQGILEAKRRRLATFDFDGVFDERYPKRQKRFEGFGRFKAGFGGKEVYYPPMYRKWSLR